MCLFPVFSFQLPAATCNVKPHRTLLRQTFAQNLTAAVVQMTDTHQGRSITN